MSRNMGTADRVIRFVLGLALIAFAMGMILPGTGFNWIGWIGIVPIATAIVGICPLYSLIGVRTCPANSSRGG